MWLAGKEGYQGYKRLFFRRKDESQTVGEIFVREGVQKFSAAEVFLENFVSDEMV